MTRTEAATTYRALASEFQHITGRGIVFYPGTVWELRIDWDRRPRMVDPESPESYPRTCQRWPGDNGRRIGCNWLPTFPNRGRWYRYHTGSTNELSGPAFAGRTLIR